MHSISIDIDKVRPLHNRRIASAASAALRSVSASTWILHSGASITMRQKIGLIRGKRREAVCVQFQSCDVGTLTRPFPERLLRRCWTGFWHLRGLEFALNRHQPTPNLLSTTGIQSERLSVFVQSHVGEHTFRHLLRVGARSVPHPGLDLDRYGRVALLLKDAVNAYLVADRNALSATCQHSW